jgi:CDP-2,3-bis-(O-geranylgeranyl)-sn-glycerol synthase
MTPCNPVVCAAFVLLAFVPAGLAHSLWLRTRWAAACRLPLDGGLTCRGRRLFGDNKTLAGFMVLPLAVGLSFGLLRLTGDGLAAEWRRGLWPLSAAGFGLLGCWTGIGFMAGELPNSFVKRQLGVAPGAAPAGSLARLACFTADRLDSLAGAFLAQALVVEVSLGYAACILLVGPGLHWLFSDLLFLLGVKGRPS